MNTTLLLLLLHGAPDDPFAAKKTYESGCARGDATACAWAANWHNSQFLVIATGASHAPDAANAQKFARKAIAGLVPACDGGDVDACVVLSNLYWQADGVPRDDAKRVSYLERACSLKKKGGPCFELGQIFKRSEPLRSLSAHVAACELADKNGCQYLCGRLDVWLLSGPDASKPMPDSERMAKVKDAAVAQREPLDGARCAMAAELFQGNAKSAAEGFAKVWTETPAQDRDQVLVAAGAMLASRAGGNVEAARDWAAKFLAAAGTREKIIAGLNNESIAATKAIAIELSRTK